MCHNAVKQFMNVTFYLTGFAIMVWYADSAPVLCFIDMQSTIEAVC
jgi:hypothetical protein